MAPSPKPIAIVGGGLAGLTLGIGLRQHGVPVTVWEAGHYPRHRVCGEFISGRGHDTLRRLGLLEDLTQAGAVQADSAVFFTERRAFARRALPEPAWCVSRFSLDARLAETFRRLGGDLRCDSRQAADPAEGLVRASGRRASPSGDGWGWFGLKAHAVGVALQADLELHFRPDGYVGLCRLGADQVNVCGLFHRRRDETVPLPGGGGWQRLLGEGGTVLKARLAEAQWDEDSFCAVAGLSLAPRRGRAGGDCSIGDALTMIPPFTGNGMSIAFESAELALEPLTAYARGEQTWEKARATLADKCEQAFAARLRHARWLHRLLFLAPARHGLLPLVTGCEGLWRLGFRLTR